MSMLSTEQLSLMRAQVADMLPDICTILSATNAADGQGGFVTTWGTVTASTACRLDSKQGDSQLSAGRITDFHGYTLTLPYTATIAEGYRVVHGGVTYQVANVDSDKSWPVTIRAIVERV